MSTKHDITIRQNRTTTLVITVTGVTSWAGLNAKMYIANDIQQDPSIELDGTIIDAENKITINITAANTAQLNGVYVYEVVLYNADMSYVKTVMHGKLNVVDVIKVLS